MTVAAIAMVIRQPGQFVISTCVGDADAVDGDCDGSCHCLQQWRYIIPNCGVQVRIGGRW